MKRPVIIAILLLIALGAFIGVGIFPAAADAVINIKEFPITNDSNDQYLPDIDGYHIGYQDNRNGNWEISLAELSYSATPMPVSASPATPDGPIGDSEQGRGALSVASIPFRATILIDGTDYGTTNKLVKDVPAGTRNLTLIKAGYQPTSMLVEVPEGGLKALPSVILVPAEGAGTPGGTGSLSIASIPFGATILIDGTDYGTTNKLVKDVPAGTRNLTLIKAGYQPTSMLVNVPEGGLKALPSVILVKGEGAGTPGGTGSLSVASIPFGATILIDGTDYGTTNKLVKDVPAGTRNLTLIKAGYQPTSIQVEVPEEGLKALPSVILVPAEGAGTPGGTGSLSIASIPFGATILIDGTDYGTTNKLVKDVPAGTRNLTLIKAGYQPTSMLVDVPEGGLKALPSVILVPGEGAGTPGGTGSLSIASIPFGATILIDGTDYGTTNKLVKDVPAGTRNLTLIKAGYQPTSMLVDVPEGGLKALPSVILVKAPQLPGDVETLQAAVDAAFDGDTILLKKGTYHENIVINKSVTLIGFGPGSTIISGDTGAEIIKGGVINITKPLLQSSGPNVTLVGMTIMQGTAQYGGGIFNSEGTLTLSGVSITNSTASFSGGGIYNQMGTVVMNGSMVAENTAKVGAGVMNDGGTFVLNEGSSISGNSAQIAGGLDNLAGTVIMNDGSSLTNNSATYDGGGMYSYFYSTITLNGGTITSNTAETGTGGGIYSDSDSIVNLFGGDVSGNIPNDIYYFT